MIDGLFLFPKSIDPQTLDDFLSTRFRPQHMKLPGLRSFKLSVGDLMSPSGPPPYSRVAETSFESLDDVMAIVQSPASQAVRDYMKSLGTLILMYEVIELPIG
jgi:uncharacterized protein (TIGR02118 family)